MLLLFDVIILMYGLYTIYSSIMMKRTGKLSGWFTGAGGAMVRDARGYIGYIYGRALVMGAVAALFGVAALVNDCTMPIHKVMQALILLFLTVCVWFYATISRAKRRFW